MFLTKLSPVRKKIIAYQAEELTDLYKRVKSQQEEVTGLTSQVENITGLYQRVHSPKG